MRIRFVQGLMRFAPALLLFLLPAAGIAEMMGPNRLPADRVIANLAAKIKENPKDAHAEYMLGRTYYSLYCSRDPRSIRLYGTAEYPSFPSVHTSPWEFKDLPNKPDDATSISLAKNAILHLQRAVKLGGGEPGLYQLTLACAYEASAHCERQIDPHSRPFRELALRASEASFRESYANDQKRPYQKMSGSWESWISMEACDGILRLDPNSKLKPQVVAHRKKMESLPTGPITPLIFSLSKSSTLSELLDPNCIVHFDLDGTGAPQTYTWVRPETAFLVWQPRRGETIRSGRQFFGSATWWLMPSNAYEALTLLDDNHDGWITANELDSLAVWQDLNQNGIAEPNEVTSVKSLGIVGLNTKFTGRIGESYVSDCGIRFADGTTLPTYDWVTRQSSIH